MQTPAISRRQLLQLSAASAAALGGRFVNPFAAPPPHRMIAFIFLDVDAEQMHRRSGDILRWVQHYRPQSNTRKPPWDPKRPNDPRNERLLTGEYGKAVKASELSLTIANTYHKARRVKSGIVALRAAADRAHIRTQLDELLFTGLQAHTVFFDHPDDGVVVPEGWSWDWTLTVPAEVAAEKRRAWTAAGWTLTDTPGVKLARERVASRGQPTGWLRADRGKRRGIQYTIMPDLRIPECRAWLIGRYRGVLAETQLRRVNVAMKSGWLHGASSIRNTPATPQNADPWLPSPYPGDSYRDATNELVVELAAAVDEGTIITVSNSALPPKGTDLHLPAYVRTSHGGLADLSAGQVLPGHLGTILRLP